MIKKTTTSGACGHLDWFVENKGVWCCEFKEVGFDSFVVLPWIATKSQTVECVGTIGILDGSAVSDFYDFSVVIGVFYEFNL